MPSWLIKAAAQGAISTLPGSHRVNHWCQRHLTASAVLTQPGFDGKVQQCCRHLENHRAMSGAEPAAFAVELGTGWYPVLPIGLALAGVRQIVTVDTSRLLSTERCRRVVDLYASGLTSGRLDPRLLAAVDPGRAERLVALAAEGDTAADADALLGRLGVRTLVGDARASGLPPGSVDLFVSSNTLEHIAPQLLRGILDEFRRLAAPGAVMSHFIDISDHYAHFDGQISELNYLRFSDRTWRLFNNALQYQNRLRASDYRAMIEQAGFRVRLEDPERGDPELLARLPLAQRFRRYDAADLLVLRCWMTAVAGGRLQRRGS